MTRTLSPTVALVAAALLVAGCSGGSQTSSLPAGPGSGPSKKTTHARLSIKVPPQKHHKKIRVHGHYVSPSTASLTYTVTPALQGGATSGEIDISATSPGCSTTGVIGYLNCTIDIPGIVPGTPYTFGFTTWDQAGGAGDQLSANDNVLFTAVAGTSNTLSATLGGIASSLVISPITPYRMSGAGAAFTIYGNHPVKFSVTPIDAQDNFIIGPGAPQPTATLAPGATATLAAVGASSPNEWTLTSTYAPTDPTKASLTSISVSATPVPGSGGSTVSASAALALYQPWIYITDGGTGVYVFDEDGNAIANAPTFSSTASLSGVAFGGGHLYLYNSGEGSSTVINAYALTGGSPVYSIDGGTNGDLGALIEPEGIAFDPNNQQVYVGGEGYTYPGGDILAFDSKLTTEEGIASVHGSYGLVYIPQSQQIAYSATIGGLGLCNEALTTCSNFSTPGLNGLGLGYDPNTQLLGYNLACCDGPATGVQLTGTSGNVGTLLALGTTNPSQPTFDPYDGLWYFGTGNASPFGIQAYTETNVPVITSFPSLPTSSKVSGIAVVL